jgi:hypothetical protein
MQMHVEAANTIRLRYLSGVLDDDGMRTGGRLIVIATHDSTRSGQSNPQTGIQHSGPYDGRSSHAVVNVSENSYDYHTAITRRREIGGLDIEILVVDDASAGWPARGT